ncbi:hypothetical protein KVL30_07195 [Helicobacter pylori]|uniref:hypothetical protein n=1 Tax=Helicobacter pylori TaxID=210 RepID=UPI002928F4F2|nr:hypothetical protein [Helicobacter pylori]MDU9795172.1 hypothetical protein [Helicobacter pylori]WRB38852.1 hypothetical protein KVL30_07195 [Helicobacter pylori]WRB44496.1 hypothetical protein KVK83_06935 [Helicobacter pylori]WRB47322.1 hypothetical protein KVK28_06910 [Helicobacter pylori]WRD02645.1 hypothetical protein E5K82_07060 [Helicobacter pylori]
MKKPSSYQKLKAENTALKAENKALEWRIERLESKLERMYDLILEKMDTQKFIYYKGDDNNSVGKLVGIGSKREGSSTLYPYVGE